MRRTEVWATVIEGKLLLYNKNCCFTHKPVFCSDRHFPLRRLKSVPTELEFSNTELSGWRLQNSVSFTFLSAIRRTPHPYHSDGLAILINTPHAHLRRTAELILCELAYFPSSPK